MTEHIAVPSVTGGSMLPASVEKKLATTWIREKLGFKGILTTDDLWYAHVVKRFGENEVAVLAVEAGHDIVLKPKDPAGAIQALVAAVRSGRIPRGADRRGRRQAAGRSRRGSRFTRTDSSTRAASARSSARRRTSRPCRRRPTGH